VHLLTQSGHDEDVQRCPLSRVRETAGKKRSNINAVTISDRIRATIGATWRAFRGPVPCGVHAGTVDTTQELADQLMAELEQLAAGQGCKLDFGEIAAAFCPVCARRRGKRALAMRRWRANKRLGTKPRDALSQAASHHHRYAP
jgi:hypothetical protein